ncbi:hypothetical protein RJ639_015674 [Escallonia herrerae]|uniref:Uncharacterized protein n=1 Tax=Escallonia herrerae TaxID=1293975 RepID=A0AA88VAS9_9ASTE|nr:hypothetical protein RJ639_015674 [Escallonia herrerae]
MAQETLGELGGSLATVTYVFLGYTSMIAYSSKSGEILYHLINLPESVSGILFTTLFTILISVGGTRATDQVNQWLTASMIGHLTIYKRTCGTGLLLAIEVLAIMFGGWSGFEGSGDWGKVPATFPVMIFSLVYHDLAPVLSAYLGGDLRRIRTSVLIGSIVPLLALLVWDAIAIGLFSQADQFTDPVELLTRVKWGGVPVMVEAFSLLAVGTSLLGTLLSFSQFFNEQLTNIRGDSGTRKWWTKNKVNFTATAIVIAPSLLVSTTVPDVFSAATDIAQGVGNVWNESKNADQKGISRARPALLGVGLFAFAIVVEQILQDLTKLQP